MKGEIDRRHHHHDQGVEREREDSGCRGRGDSALSKERVGWDMLRQTILKSSQ
jgi:hypothetical protein